MAGKRRAFTNEFKAEAVRLVTVDGHPVSQVAKDLGIHDSLLRRWQRKLDARRVREVGMKPSPTSRIRGILRGPLVENQTVSVKGLHYSRGSGPHHSTQDRLISSMAARAMTKSRRRCNPIQMAFGPGGGSDLRAK
jgi:transposase-like protein